MRIIMAAAPAILSALNSVRARFAAHADAPNPVEQLLRQAAERTNTLIMAMMESTKSGTYSDTFIVPTYSWNSVCDKIKDKDL